MPQYQISKPPFHSPLVDDGGKMHPVWQRYFNSIHETLSNNFNTSGTQIPPVKSNEVGTNDNGVMYYNSDKNTYEGFVGGVRHVFTTTPA